MNTLIENPKVSVIMPVCNVENMVSTAIDSVIDQTLREIEILIIDDGSTDNSGEICEAYAEKDSRIRVIHKQNDGLGRAIDTGVEEARGEYIGIVEADDNISPHMYEEMYALAKECDTDILKCGFIFCYDGKEKETSWIYDIAKEREVFEIRQKPSLLQLAASWWAALYSSRFLKENNIKNVYSPGATYQDFFWMVQTFSLAKRISIIHKAFYYYNLDNPNSSIKETGKKGFYIMFHCMEGNRILRERGLWNDVKEEIACHEFSACLSRVRFLRDDCRKEYFDRFREVIDDINREGEVEFKYLGGIDRHFLSAVKNGHRKRFFMLADLWYKMRDSKFLVGIYRFVKGK